MVVIFLYVIIISIVSYFLIEKKAKIKNSTIFILTAFIFGFDVSFYKYILIDINDTSIINEIGRILLYHFIFGFIMIYTHLILFVAYKFIFSNIEIKLIKETKISGFKDVNKKEENDDQSEEEESQPKKELTKEIKKFVKENKPKKVSSKRTSDVI